MEMVVQAHCGIKIGEMQTKMSKVRCGQKKVEVKNNNYVKQAKAKASLGQ